MKDASHVDLSAIEPLVRSSDLAEYRQGLERHQSGEWDAERFTAFRLRYGVYGQKQPGVQMVRIKIPGGIVPTPWLKTLARVNRDFAKGPAHITTRQDFQLYYIPLERSADMLEVLAAGGITTREACGNTLRNMTSCALAGACGRELVDAGKVAEQLARTWMRHPLVQHMPRKMKFTVSGCATDCGASPIHDLGFVAVEKGGKKGFKVLAGGGLGGQPIMAVEVLPFVIEEDLPTVIEATARIHQRYSNRRDRALARLKFVLRRFGPEKFTSLFQEEFDRLKNLPQRPWQPLAWRNPVEAPVARTPAGVVPGHDGKVALVIYVPLGIIDSDQLDALHDIAVAAGVSRLSTTRDQKLALLDVARDKVEEVTKAVRSIGFDIPAAAEDVPDVVSCPGTTTCRIGITNSQSFGLQVEKEARGQADAKGVSVHVSGCQNSCGLHHVADIGLHGMGKKIDGKPAPHYQLHFGGDAYSGQVGLEGPIVPARLANRAVALLRQEIQGARAQGESVRAWAERLGKDGIAEVLKPLAAGEGEDLFTDWGDADIFVGPPKAKGECAAPQVSTTYYTDLADDGLINLDRFLSSGRWPEALKAGEEATVYALRLLLAGYGVVTEDEQDAEGVFALFRSSKAATIEAVNAFESVLAERTSALVTGEAVTYREAVAYFIDTVGVLITRPKAAVVAEVGDLASILAVVA
ncbi:nitrite/sulfite reductase [Paramagnetospirillum magneticum]|uniref:Sulfite reductase n=1 Tax=Paramagnetospirillum magneticum (strain ATCC 700264 / AMB-1) TaxID=342108 RepID=Q2W562_PARM1|nr:nitrite/sulfite reductase [Paramagnetospirillum magneticum]BAE51013.1 Sulfite reductase [Paramagnetospirillum magneticum AMB-1]